MPLIPLVMLFFSPKTAGDAALLSLIGFAVVLAVKGVVFLVASDFRRIRAVWYTIIAGFVSTIIGLLITIMFLSPDYLLIGIIVIFLLALFPAIRIKTFGRCQRYSKFTITFIIAMLTLIMIVLFAHSSGYQTAANISLAVKIIFSTLALALSVILSIVYEESIMSRLYLTAMKEPKNFFRPIIWVNVTSVLLIVIAAAIWTLTVESPAQEIKISELLFFLTGI